MEVENAFSSKKKNQKPKPLENLESIAKTQVWGYFFPHGKQSLPLKSIKRAGRKHTAGQSEHSYAFNLFCMWKLPEPNFLWTISKQQVRKETEAILLWRISTLVSLFNN